jgi:hypothetical protein
MNPAFSVELQKSSFADYTQDNRVVVDLEKSAKNYRLKPKASSLFPAFAFTRSSAAIS